MHKLLLLTALATCGIAKAQTTLFSEDFELGTSGQFTLNTMDMSSTASGINDWVVNQSYVGGPGSLICLGFPFSYTVSSTAAQPGGIINSPNSFYMHMRSDEAAADGMNCSSFTPADGLCFLPENNFTKMNIDISTIGYTGVELSFWWACGGEAGTAYGEVYYSTNGGMTWNLITSPIAQYQGQSTWIQQTIPMAAFDNVATLRFGFRFVNGTATAPTEPGFQLDDIMITGNGCSASGSTMSPTICQGDSYFAQGANQVASGTYYDTLVNSCGADSVITTNLTVTPVNVGLTVTGLTLTANATGATYQWIDCSTTFPIAGATLQSYTATANGSYGVLVTEGGCTDLSACINITGVGINEIETENLFSISPNPFNEQTTITVNNGMASETDVLLTDATGRKLIPSVTKQANKITLQRNGLANGVYFVQLIQKGTIKSTLKVVVR